MGNVSLKDIVRGYEQYIEENGITEDAVRVYVSAAYVALNELNDHVYLLELTARIKQLIEQLVVSLTGGTIWELEKFAQENMANYELLDQYYEILKLESFDRFESFIRCMEKQRPWKKRFYQPREKTLHIVADDLQNLEDTGIDFQGISQPSRTGKSTICILFLLWIAMKRPNSHSAMGGHSGILAKGFYKELLNMMTNEEYTFKELFFFWHPKYANKPFPTDKSAEDFTITIGDHDRFATITCRGIDGTWTGAIDVSSDGYLYVDDLIRDRQHSLSPMRMEDTFQEYLNKMVDRKNDGAKELMVGTLWNVMDPLERIRKKNIDNPAYKFRKIPALNENDESNFDYEINGFSTKYYHDMRNRLDKAEWEAKFMQNPFVREGLLFESDELRRFNGILPDGDFRRVSVTDIAWGGGDSLSMPIGAEYENGDVYIYDWVFNKGPKEVTIPLVVGNIIGNEIRETRFEGNIGGDLYCQYVDEKLRENNYKCACSSKKAPNRIEKKSKIIAYSGDIKRKFIFLRNTKPTPEQRDEDARMGVKRYYMSKEYEAAMEELTMFVSIGENEHDDAADSLTQLEMFLESPDSAATVEAVQNPYRTGGGLYGN